MKIPAKYKTYKSWTLDYDHVGSIAYVNGEVAIYCSPNWEGYKGVSIEIYDYKTDAQLFFQHPMLKVTPSKWFKVVKWYLDNYGKHTHKSNCLMAECNGMYCIGE